MRSRRGGSLHVIALLLLITGRGKAKPNQTVAPPPEAKQKLIQVNAGPAELTHYSETFGWIEPPLIIRAEAKRERAWTVRWKSAQLEYMEDGDKGGDMQVVTGELYEGDEVASQFSADVGHADRETGNLEISGNVRVHAEQPTADVTCDKLIWNPKTRLLIARGNVKIAETGYTLQDVPELWCSPDLKEVATPDLYEKQ